MSESKLPLVIKIITQTHLPYANTSILETHPCFSKSDVNQENRAKFSSGVNRVVLIKENVFLRPSTRTRQGLNPLFFGLFIVETSFCPRKP